jgi:hypothetical protein
MNHLQALHHLLTLLPLQVVLGGLVPILQFPAEVGYAPGGTAKA